MQIEPACVISSLRGAHDLGEQSGRPAAYIMLYFQVYLTRATIEMHHVFSDVSQAGRFRSLSKHDFEKNVKLLRPDKSSIGLGAQRESRQKLPVSDDVWVKEPHFSQNVSGEN